MCPFLADLLNVATRPTSALPAPCLRPHKKQTNHRHLCRLSMCVSLCVCVSVDRIAFEMRTLSYSKICSNGIFCPICSLSDLHCRRKQQGEPKRNFTIFSTIWNSLRTPPQPQRVFVLAQFHLDYSNAKFLVN